MVRFFENRHVPPIPEGTNLARYFTEEGFRIDPPVREAIDALVAEGWVFVVGKLRTAAPGEETFRPHPICFDFPTREAIYPMRLTAAGGKAIQLEIYVLGASRAVVDQLRVDACARVVPSPRKEHPKGNLPTPSEGIPLAQPELSSIGAGAAVVTRLSGEVGGKGQSHDLHPRWVAFERARRVLYSAQAAYGSAADYGAVAFAVIFLAACVLRRRWTVPSRLGLSCVAGLLVLAATWISFDVVDSSRIASHGFGAIPRSLLRSVAHGSASFEAIVREETNFYTGDPIREEASPGNYLRGERDAAGNQEYIIFDADGAPWSSRKAPK